MFSCKDVERTAREHSQLTLEPGGLAGQLQSSEQEAHTWAAKKSGFRYLGLGGKNSWCTAQVERPITSGPGSA